MANITPSNRLYFYQLFSTELGVGKQTPVTRIDEVLAEADVLLDDVDCTSTDEFIAELADFLKLTVFKKGRVFVTVMAREDLDALLEKAAQPVVDKDAASAGKSWKRARRSKDVKPVKPRHKRKKVVATAEVVEEEEAVIEEVAPVEETVVEEIVSVEEVVPAEAEAPIEVAEVAEVTEATVEVEVTEEATADEPEDAPAEEPEEAIEPAAPEEPSIAFDITFVPDAPEDEEPEEDEPLIVEEPLAAPREHTRAHLEAIGLPKRISDEVFLPDALMLKLYQALPPTVGILDTLDESWEWAQEVGTVQGTRTRMTFPLSRRIEGGLPAEITICRAGRLAAGKHWMLEAVNDGDE